MFTTQDDASGNIDFPLIDRIAMHGNNINSLCKYSTYNIPPTFIALDMHPLAAASCSRLLETETKLFVFETSYYAFCGRYCFESVASKIK